MKFNRYKAAFAASFAAILAVATTAYNAFTSLPPQQSKIALPSPKAASTVKLPASKSDAAYRQVTFGAHLNWDEEARTSVDHFKFIQSASKAGLAGDGRAAYHVAQMLMPCLLDARLYGNAANPEIEFDVVMATAAITPQLTEQKRSELRNCAGFMKGEDVFANLPTREGGYKSYKFWLDLAYRAGDPVAQTEHAALAIGNVVSPNPGSIRIAQMDINNAIASGDPEAIFRVGFFISNGLSVDRIQGYAISLAACDLGYDCSASNASLVFGYCVAMSTCPEGTLFSDYVVKDIGPDGYAQAYNRAQQIEQALAENDIHALQQFAHLKDVTSTAH